MLLSGILLLRTRAAQAELEAFEASQAQQFAHYQQTAAHLHQVRLVRHDIYNYIQAALYLSRDGTPRAGRRPCTSLSRYTPPWTVRTAMNYEHTEALIKLLNGALAAYMWTYLIPLPPPNEKCAGPEPCMPS